MGEIASISPSDEYERELYKDILKKLTKCGFSNKRCLKAIASTGVFDERVAGEWLSSHIDDPDLDKDYLRDYFVYLSPNGALREALMNFWKACKREGLWGLAQEYSPHITIIPRFQIPDNKVAELHNVLRERIVKQPLGPSLMSSPLEILSTSDPSDLKKNFIGYQASGKAKSSLESFSNALLSDLDNIGIIMDEVVRKSRKGIFHLSLSYGFSQTHLNSLTALIEQYITQFIKEDSLDKWNVCLYSCDSRFRNIEELYRMRTSLKSWHLNDMLTLAYNGVDLVGLLSGPPGNIHGAGLGINYNTGLTGVFILQEGERVPLYYVWTLHRQWPLMIVSDSKVAKNVVTHPISTAENHVNSKSTKSSGRRLYVMRHGERVDFCFKNWIPKCFDSKEIYRRHNLNMPVFLPRRKKEQFFHDSPLTMIGIHMAYETGIALKNARVTFTKCYSSVALRCVQTATHCLRGLGQESLGICVEPLLFEWMGWYSAQRPSFMPVEQLKAEGLCVNSDYVPLSREADLKCTETPSQYYERKGRLVRRLLDANKHKGSVVLIVGHAASLDVCTRPFVSRAPWPPQVSDQEFRDRSIMVPFCGIVVAEEHALRWHLVEPPILPFSHCKNAEFNWQQMGLSH